MAEDVCPSSQPATTSSYAGQPVASMFAGVLGMNALNRSLAGCRNGGLIEAPFESRFPPSNRVPSRGGEGRVKTAELFEISACEIFHKHL